MDSNKLNTKNLGLLVRHIPKQRGFMFGVILLTALIAFEIFNFSTTEFALSDLLGRLQFMGLRWATILAIAFCAIDFAGIARLFTPEKGGREVNEIWYLFGAWMLAAIMNAMLTWWGVSIAIINNDSLGSGVLSRETLLSIVPLFVAILVWLIRVLMIGTFALAGERLFSQVEENPLPNKVDSSRSSSRHMPVTARTRAYPAPEAIEAASIQTYRPAPKPINHGSVNHHHQEPEYQPLPVTAQSRNSGYQPEFSNH